jgi:hypothetical protein
MHRRKVIAATAAVFAIGVAFAAQPVAVRPDLRGPDFEQRGPWVPGTNSLISTYDSAAMPLAPPR